MALLRLGQCLKSLANLSSPPIIIVLLLRHARGIAVFTTLVEKMILLMLFQLVFAEILAYVDTARIVILNHRIHRNGLVLRYHRGMISLYTIACDVLIIILIVGNYYSTAVLQ